MSNDFTTEPVHKGNRNVLVIERDGVKLAVPVDCGFRYWIGAEARLPAERSDNVIYFVTE